jgi:hypothetical protein
MVDNVKHGACPTAHISVPYDHPVEWRMRYYDRVTSVWAQSWFEARTKAAAYFGGVPIETVHVAPKLEG